MVVRPLGYARDKQAHHKSVVRDGVRGKGREAMGRKAGTRCGGKGGGVRGQVATMLTRAA